VQAVEETSQLAAISGYEPNFSHNRIIISNRNCCSSAQYLRRKQFIPKGKLKMALVIKKWYAGTTQNKDGNYVHLIGREAGLFAWLLSVIGIDPTTEVESGTR
jgi:hypothetical protein